MKQKLLLILFLFCTTYARSQWTNQQVPFTNTCAFFDLEVVDANIVWADFQIIGSTSSTPTNQFAKTVNGGNVWTIGTINGVPSTYGVENVWPIDADTCYVSMANDPTGGGIYKTTDGGTNWTRMGTSNMFDANSFPDFVYFFNAAEGVAVGDPNPVGVFEIWTTNDYGATWSRVPSMDIPAADAADYGYSNLFSAYGDNIWFATDQGIVYASTDKGHTWSAYSTGMIVQTQTIDDIVFVDDQNGFCFQAGLIYRTFDGGVHWINQISSGTLYTWDVERIPATDFLVSSGSLTGAAGTSYSMDLGATWITIDTGNSHTGIAFLNKNVGWTGEISTGISGGAWSYTGSTLSVEPMTDKTPTFSVYPNPVSGFVTIKVTNVNEELEVKIVDMQGRSVYNNKFDHPGDFFARMIDLTSFSKGLYSVILDGKSVHATQKVLIQ